LFVKPRLTSKHTLKISNFNRETL